MADDNDGPILVLDDDPQLLVALTRILEREGHDVLTARDGATAVRMTIEHRPGLLVLDYMMPGMDGAMVLEALREQIPDSVPPTLLLTASGEPVERARLCLSCHFGDPLRFANHRIMGAGHPRMSFELDTFTALQPAHFKVDADYRKRTTRDIPIFVCEVAP